MRSIAIGLLGILLTCGTASAQTVAEQAQVLRDFERSVADYRARLGCLDPAHGANATPAPRIFTLPVAMVFRQVIARSLDEGIPTTDLANVLPPLPGRLEYRLIGRDLVLGDRDTDEVVAVLREALGAVATTKR